MRTLRVVLVPVLLVFMLVGLVPSSFAASVTHFNVRLNDVTIPWLFPPPEGLSSFCPEIPDGVHINPDDFGSDRVKQASLKEMPDGTAHVVVTDLIKGTATDNFGVSYRFVYKNNLTIDFDGSVADVAMQDTFELKGGDVNYTFGFNWRWAYPTDSLELVEVIDGGETVDVAVNPFFFATADGVTEAPEIVPGSWQQVSTRGDVSCDPL